MNNILEKIIEKGIGKSGPIRVTDKSIKNTDGVIFEVTKDNLTITTSGKGESITFNKDEIESIVDLENPFLAVSNYDHNDLCGNTWCKHNDKQGTCVKILGLNFSCIGKVENTRNEQLIELAYKGKSDCYEEDTEYVNNL